MLLYIYYVFFFFSLILSYSNSINITKYNAYPKEQKQKK